MNSQAHTNIMQGAFAALCPEMRTDLEPLCDLLPKVGSYPDYFDDPSRPDSEKEKIDPEWRRFCVLPDEIGAPSFHRLPFNVQQQDSYCPLIEYWLENAITAWRAKDRSGFLKFIGCISHYIGDMTQPAHLLNHLDDMVLLRQLVPPPAGRENFNYHVDLEAITGKCGPLLPAHLLGTSVIEAAWRLAAHNREGVAELRRYIVPTLHAIFADNSAETERLAEPPVTRAAQLTLDIFHTALRLAAGVGALTCKERADLKEIDLRFWTPVRQAHDVVYGSRAIVDGSSDIPPYPGPVLPAKLRFPSGVRIVRGLGMLPHSGLSGPRECTVTHTLPAAAFSWFQATVGVHPELGRDGAVEFSIELDGKEVWSSGRRTGMDMALPVRHPLGKSREMTLRVRDANKGRTFWKNHAVWEEPKLVKESVT